MTDRPPVFVQELSLVPEPHEALERLQDLRNPLLLESVARDSRLGRYSFLMADPVAWFERERVTFGESPFAEIAEAVERFTGETITGLPPFQGGAAGLLGYDLGQAFERLPPVERRGGDLPALAVGIYAWVIAWDHEQGRAWLIAHGDAARSRADTILMRLLGASPAAISGTLRGGEEWRADFPFEGPAGTRSTFSRDHYCEAVARVIDAIHAGEIFQANLTQQLALPLEETPTAIYRKLRRANPAPFSGFFSNGEWAIASSSPERFLCVQDGRVETRPIKGTRPRHGNAALDRESREMLAASEKDRAENIMIVDLLRNDLSRVCEPHSVRVPELCAVESYETVHHLVSTVEGTLSPGKSVWDLLAATFPGGSITGAPKIRAMEILAELEPIARGPYCGSLFYAGFDGACDSSILIRTMELRGGHCRFGVGGGITALSDPEVEYAETLDKASGMLRVFAGAGEVGKGGDDTVDR